MSSLLYDSIWCWIKGEHIFMVIAKDRRSVICRQASQSFSAQTSETALQRQGHTPPPATSNPWLRLRSLRLADKEINGAAGTAAPLRGPSAVSLLRVTLWWAHVPSEKAGACMCGSGASLCAVCLQSCRYWKQQVTNATFEVTWLWRTPPSSILKPLTLDTSSMFFFVLLLCHISL